MQENYKPIDYSDYRDGVKRTLINAVYDAGFTEAQVLRLGPGRFLEALRGVMMGKAKIVPVISVDEGVENGNTISDITGPKPEVTEAETPNRGWRSEATHLRAQRDAEAGEKADKGWKIALSVVRAQPISPPR